MRDRVKESLNAAAADDNGAMASVGSERLFWWDTQYTFIEYEK